MTNVEMTEPALPLTDRERLNCVFDGLAHVRASPEAVAMALDISARKARREMASATARVEARQKAGTLLVLAADAALNKNKDLFQEAYDGTLKAGVNEGFAYARAVEVISRTAKSWTFKNNAGETVDSLSEITAKTVEDQLTFFVNMVASRIEYPKIPTPEEIAKEGFGLPPSTTSS